ncbi:DUF4062 domain-containing protein [Burkholderia contaminans]|nr:DUF4062 domain-containing protein [Burkholderia contaminans]
MCPRLHSVRRGIFDAQRARGRNGRHLARHTSSACSVNLLIPKIPFSREKSVVSANGVHNRLRAFISSTMEDLGNERRAVVQQLRSMGIEPVNAEDMAPDGRSSWETIQEQIEDCHLFVLILGDRYGWMPDRGYGAGSGLSVTHLEFNAARASKKLVLTFMKSLRYGAPVDNKRDDFRKEVADWSTGFFRQEFVWADELATKVSDAIVSLWTDALQKELVRRAEKPASLYPVSVVSPQPAHIGASPVLLAGAGMSISAGYPTALLLMEIMARDLWNEQPETTSLSHHSFSDLATYYEQRLGGKALRQRIVDVLDTPQAVSPTPAHLRAVLAYKNIVTTNYDPLFERACDLLGVAMRVVHPFDNAFEGTFDGVTLFKLVGSASTPDTLILTNSDLQRAASGPAFANAKLLIGSNDLVVIGHSLRDENVQQLLLDRGLGWKATYVSPSNDVTDDVLMSQYGFTRVTSTADDFLARSVGQPG